MGYSGSIFFTTTDSRYLVKSIPRHFEHSFFKNDMLLPYAEYMQSNPTSLLCRITDFLECIQSSVGTLFGLAPSHHIVMENILFGKGEDGSEWGHWDLLEARRIRWRVWHPVEWEGGLMGMRS